MTLLSLRMNSLITITHQLAVHRVESFSINWYTIVEFTFAARIVAEEILPTYTTHITRVTHGESVRVRAQAPVVIRV